MEQLELHSSRHPHVSICLSTQQQNFVDMPLRVHLCLKVVIKLMSNEPEDLAQDIISRTNEAIQGYVEDGPGTGTCGLSWNVSWIML